MSSDHSSNLGYHPKKQGKGNQLMTTAELLMAFSGSTEVVPHGKISRSVTATIGTISSRFGYV